MIWQGIANNCDPVPPVFGFPGLYLTAPDVTPQAGRWLIGPYNALARLAPQLRTDEQKRDFLADLHVRFGERATDMPPSGSRRPRIGEKGLPVLSDHLAERRTNVTAGAPAARETDMYENAAKFWATQTLQAHHIVEKSILTALTVNSGDLADSVAPCVLLVAEFHQRLFTSEMAGARGQFQPTMTGAQAYLELKKIYDSLYARPVLAELRVIADLINRAARARKK